MVTLDCYPISKLLTHLAILCRIGFCHASTRMNAQPTPTAASTAREGKERKFCSSAGDRSR